QRKKGIRERFSFDLRGHGFEDARLRQKPNLNLKGARRWADALLSLTRRRRALRIVSIPPAPILRATIVPRRTFATAALRPFLRLAFELAICLRRGFFHPSRQHFEIGQIEQVGGLRRHARLVRQPRALVMSSPSTSLRTG